MNNANAIRKSDVILLAKVEIARGEIERAIDLCVKNKIPSRVWNQLVREFEVKNQNAQSRD